MALKHIPDEGTPSLHWSACHSCLFAPETSCERGNKLLDRSVLIPTVTKDALAFFVIKKNRVHSR